MVREACRLSFPALSEKVAQETEHPIAHHAIVLAPRGGDVGRGLHRLPNLGLQSPLKVKLHRSSSSSRSSSGAGCDGQEDSAFEDGKTRQSRVVVRPAVSLAR